MIFFLNLRQAFFCQLEFGIVEFLGGGYRGLVAIDNIWNTVVLRGGVSMWTNWAKLEWEAKRRKEKNRPTYE